MEKANIEILEERKVQFAHLSDKFNPEGSKLRRYQLHLVKTLKEFDFFCREHGIVYYLAYGSLLGAVRHKGFIPWDDDADIWMDRDNFNKLMGLMHGEHNQLSDNVYVAKGIRPELWSPPFAYVDIFVLDVAPGNRLLAKAKSAIVKLLYAMVKCRGRINSHKFGKFKPYFVLAPFALLASAKRWKSLYDWSATWFSNGKNIQNASYLQSYNNVPSYVNYHLPSGEDVWQPVETEFDGAMLIIPKGYDCVLRAIYGDYMQVPDEDKIHVHGIVENVDI